MKNVRFSLRGLMGMIAGIGLMLAALLQPSPLVASLLWTATLTILMIAALMAVLDPRRIFVVGFALVGLLFATFSALTEVTDRSPILTTRLFTYIYIWISDGNSTYATKFYYHGTLPRSFLGADVRFLAFHRIGDSVAALIHGTAGGILALFLHARLRRGPEPNPEP